MVFRACIFTLKCSSLTKRHWDLQSDRVPEHLQRNLSVCVSIHSLYYFQVHIRSQHFTKTHTVYLNWLHELSSNQTKWIRLTWHAIALETCGLYKRIFTSNLISRINPLKLMKRMRLNRDEQPTHQVFPVPVSRFLLQLPFRHRTPLISGLHIFLVLSILFSVLSPVGKLSVLCSIS